MKTTKYILAFLLLISFSAIGQTPVETDSVISERRQGLNSYAYPDGGVSYSGNGSNQILSRSGLDITISDGNTIQLPIVIANKPYSYTARNTSTEVDNSWAETVGLEDHILINEKTTSGLNEYPVGDLFTSAAMPKIKPDNFDASMIFLAESGFSVEGKTATGYVDTTQPNMPEGILIDSNGVAGFRKRGTRYIFDGQIQAFSRLPKLAGVGLYPSAISIAYESTYNTNSDATLTLVPGSPNEVQYTSNNSSGGDFVSQDIIHNPVIGDAYRFVGEQFFQSGTFGHMQLRQVNGGVSQRFEAVISNTTSYQSFDFTLTLTSTDDVVIDFAGDGQFKWQNLRITKVIN